MRYHFITIEGNIGSGKTSLAEKIARDYRGRLCLEKFADNPFLTKFYENPRQYAFSLEMYFMAERFQQMKTLSAERDLFNDFLVSDFLFAKSLLFAEINLDGDEILLFKKLFSIIYPNIPKPQMTVYLHNDISNLLLNISKRGRNYEKNISADYLEKIQSAYLGYFKSLQKEIVLIVNTYGIDFVENESDYKKLLELFHRDYSPGIHIIQP